MSAITVDTFGSLLTDLAEKLGETTQNTENNRKRKLNSAYFYIANKDLWWWTEGSDTDTTTTALSYTLPTDFRAYHPKNPLKVGDDWRILVPFKDLQLWDGTNTVVSLSQLKSKKRAYIYGGKVYFIQSTMTADQTITHYYYKRITTLDETTDEPLMPVEYREMISLYAAGMYLKAQGGKESVEGNDYLELFDSYLNDMNQEQQFKREFGIKRRALDPEEANIFES